MPRAKHPCTGCGQPTAGRGRCQTCKAQADKQRGTRIERGYDAEHDAFRTAVLGRDKLCRCTARHHWHRYPHRCGAPSTVADHWPDDKKLLILRGIDPNHPTRGRGVCKRCHDAETALRQPGGWNALK